MPKPNLPKLELWCKAAEMTGNYYCPDNFFKKMTDLESPRKYNDCYFYYYSTCAKGDNCTFRHEPSALGCETMCSFWKEGKCLNVHCNFRHMELRKNRKVIPCYWESQPGGCLKPHCPFLHQTSKPASADESHNSKADSGTESADNTMNEKLSHMSDKSFKNAPVDALVVNFEEESDNESAPSHSPIKATQRVPKVKTLEEIKLEKIQAESAAYYSYPEVQVDDPDNLRQRIWERFQKKRGADSFNPGLRIKRSKPNAQFNEIKIKTLDEIRAERAQKTQLGTEICDNSVSSSQDVVPPSKPQRIKLQRRPLFLEKKEDENVMLHQDTISEEFSESKDEDMLNVSESTKVLDEVLLLQDDDDNSNVSYKDEDRLLSEFDDFLEN